MVFPWVFLNQRSHHWGAPSLFLLPICTYSHDVSIDSWIIHLTSSYRMTSDGRSRLPRCFRLIYEETGPKDESTKRWESVRTRLGCRLCFWKSLNSVLNPPFITHIYVVGHVFLPFKPPFAKDFPAMFDDWYFKGLNPWPGPIWSPLLRRSSPERSSSQTTSFGKSRVKGSQRCFFVDILRI